MAMTLSHDWHCLKCDHTFFDRTDRSPCPQCGNEAGELLEAVGAQPVAQKAAAPFKAKASTRPSIVIGLFAFLFGVPAWLEGARTTRDGWIFGVNWILARAGLPFQIPDASTWRWAASIGLMVALGCAYSRVELRWVPIRPPENLRRDFFKASEWQITRSWAAWLIWVLVLFTDVVTMVLGARQASPRDPVLLQQIAASLTAAWIYAIIITFVPDRLVQFGWRSIRG